MIIDCYNERNKKMGKYEKKSVIKNIFILTILLMGMISCSFLENKTIKVPKSIIQSKIDKKFPVTKNFLLAKVTLSNPKVSFKDEKMYIETNYSTSILAEGNRGKLYLSSGIRYDKEKEEMYLVDLSIDKMTDEKGKEIVDSKAASTVKTLIVNYVEMNPVYKVKEDNDENSKKKKIKIKNMYIKNGKFYVQT